MFLSKASPILLQTIVRQSVLRIQKYHDLLYCNCLGFFTVNARLVFAQGYAVNCNFQLAAVLEDKMSFIAIEGVKLRIIKVFMVITRVILSG